MCQRGEAVLTNGRRKGANFEREISNMIMDALGIEDVKRDIEQYRAGLHGDIIGVDGWCIECKRYASGITYKADWWEQVLLAAEACGDQPVLIWKYDRQPINCLVRMSSISSDYAGLDYVAQVDFNTWLMLVRESWA